MLPTCLPSWARYRLGRSVSMWASAVSIAFPFWAPLGVRVPAVTAALVASRARFEAWYGPGLGVSVADEEEPGREGRRGVEAEDAETGPRPEGAGLLLDGVDRFAGLQRQVGADRVLPGLRQQRHDERGHEQHAEQRCDCSGAGADHRAEAEAEQPEQRQVQAASGDRPEHTGIAQR